MCPVWLAILSHKLHDLWGNKSLNIKCVFSFFVTTFVWNISHSKKNWAGYYSTGYGRKTWRFLSYNKMKIILFFVSEFITKIIFISKHFNYDIHFLNIVSVRWRPLLSPHSRKHKTSDKILPQSFNVLRSSKWRLSSWTFPFFGRRCFSAVSHPQQYSIVTRNTVVTMNIEVPTKYLLSHNDRIVVLEIRLHSESPMLYRSALHGKWDALSLARSVLNDRFPTPTVPLTAVLPNRQVFRTLYMHICIRVKYPIFFLCCNKTWIFSIYFFLKNAQI